MKQATISFFLFLCFAIVANAQKTIPNVNVKTLDGQTVNLKDYAAKSGKTIIIEVDNLPVKGLHVYVRYRFLGCRKYCEAKKQ